jgi:hypothetical protein
MVKFAILIVIGLYLFTTMWLISSMGDSPPSISTKGDSPTIHACVRTKDSVEFMREFLLYHTAQGIHTFSIYDDSNKPNKEFFDEFPVVVFYKYVYGIKIENENHFILECLSRAIMSNKYQFVLNMDDDEFLFSTQRGWTVANHLSYNMGEWFKNNDCISNALYFFGTTKSKDTGYTTIDFVNRDRDVEGRDFKFYYRSYSNRLKNRIEKAIFRVPLAHSEKNDMVTTFTNRMKTGVMIHGYSMKCTKQNFIKVAHYTRGEKELEMRLTKFWTTVKGLRRRFNNEEKIEKYIKERNRTDVVDTRLRNSSLRIFNK